MQFALIAQPVNFMFCCLLFNFFKIKIENVLLLAYINDIIYPICDPRQFLFALCDPGKPKC